ncbi:uncharacterized protein BDV17DRAFT_275400 [Aspergillus undulatus]|uniref:uncharacterized protein n=1 Tax=Aspergillus undulatus TaxID=1810928 RepID=UPI003CCDFD7F
MSYYCCVNLVHLATIRCNALSSISPPLKSLKSVSISDGLQSSLALSVEASRSLLLFLLDSELHVNSVSFWNILFYPMSAAITIFCNLLQGSSASASAMSDMQLLALTEQATARVFLRRAGASGRAPELNPIMGFMSWLRGQAQRAMKG